MMLMFSFQMVDMAEVSIEAPLEEIAESMLGSVQTISTMWDYIHDKAAEKIKWAHNHDRQHRVPPVEVR